jgi:hypothetical protein
MPMPKLGISLMSQIERQKIGGMINDVTHSNDYKNYQAVVTLLPSEPSYFKDGLGSSRIY